MSTRRFSVKYSGKNFPDYLPSAQSIIAPDEKRAKEWTNKQLQAWSLDTEKVRVVITERLDKQPAK